MGARGKRCHSDSQSGNETVNTHKKKRGKSNKKVVNDETITYRILCPAGVVGSLWEALNSIRQETKSIVDVMGLCPGATDRVIVMESHVKDKKEVDVDDEFNDNEPLCGSQDALIRVHAAIAQHSHMQQKGKEECQILVPSSQLGNIIGENGAAIDKLRSKTGANITVTAKNGFDPTHSCAMEFDNFVLISGDSEAVRKAILAISAIIYKFPPSSFIPSVVPIYPSDVSLLYPSAPSVFGAAPLPSLQGSVEAGNAFPSPEPALPVVSGCGATPLPGLQVSAEAGNTCSSIQPALPAVSACGATPLLGLQGSAEVGNDCHSLQSDLPAVSGSVPSNAVGKVMDQVADNLTNSKKKRKPKKGKSTVGLEVNEPLPPPSNLKTDVPANAVGKSMVQGAENLTNSQKKRKPKKGKSTVGLEVNEPLPPPSNLKTDVPANAVGKSMVQGAENLTNSQKKSKKKKKNSTDGIAKQLQIFTPQSYDKIRIPESVVKKVTGPGGANLEKIQKISGACVDIENGARGESIAYISGTRDQKKEAATLIQAYIISI